MGPRLKLDHAPPPARRVRYGSATLVRASSPLLLVLTVEQVSEQNQAELRQTLQIPNPRRRYRAAETRLRGWPCRTRSAPGDRQGVGGATTDASSPSSRTPTHGSGPM